MTCFPSHRTNASGAAIGVAEIIPLTPKESATLKRVKYWQTEYRNSPRPSDLAFELKRKYDTIMYTLMKLELKGYIELLRIRKRVVIVPLYWE